MPYFSWTEIGLPVLFFVSSIAVEWMKQIREAYWRSAGFVFPFRSWIETSLEPSPFCVIHETNRLRFPIKTTRLIDSQQDGRETDQKETQFRRRLLYVIDFFWIHCIRSWSRAKLNQIEVKKSISFVQLPSPLLFQSKSNDSIFNCSTEVAFFLNWIKNRLGPTEGFRSPEGAAERRKRLAIPATKAIDVLLFVFCLFFFCFRFGFSDGRRRKK